MTQINAGTSRRTFTKAAAWATPVIAAAATAPMAATSTEPPEEATSIGGTSTSPKVGNVGFIRPQGLDPNGNEGYFPNGQTFRLLSSDLDFDTIVTAITGGTIVKLSDGEWLITPDDGVTSVNIAFNSPVPGSYRLVSEGPVDPGQSWGGTVLP